MPLISFVVAAFEQHRALRTCLSSLLDQTLDQNQIEIIVADNSLDARETMMNHNLIWMGGHIRHLHTADRAIIPEPQCRNIRHKRCLYTALEIGVAEATGDWIAFPSQDDYYAPVFADRMLAVSSATDAEFVHCDVVLGGPGHGYFTLGTAPRNCAIDKCAFIMKRSWFDGFKDKWDNYELEDGYFVERLVERGIRVAKCEQVLACHN